MKFSMKSLGFSTNEENGSMNRKKYPATPYTRFEIHQVNSTGKARDSPTSSILKTPTPIFVTTRNSSTRTRRLKFANGPVDLVSLRNGSHESSVSVDSSVDSVEDRKISNGEVVLERIEVSISPGKTMEVSPETWKAFLEYKKFGDYSNETEKTDYTYSRLSKYRHKEIIPGFLIRPNMSRPSISSRRSSVSLPSSFSSYSESFNTDGYDTRVYNKSNTTEVNYDFKTPKQANKSTRSKYYLRSSNMAADEAEDTGATRTSRKSSSFSASEIPKKSVSYSNSESTYMSSEIPGKYYSYSSSEMPSNSFSYSDSESPSNSYSYSVLTSEMPLKSSSFSASEAPLKSSSYSASEVPLKSSSYSASEMPLKSSSYSASEMPLKSSSFSASEMRPKSYSYSTSEMPDVLPQSFSYSYSQPPEKMSKSYAFSRSEMPENSSPYYGKIRSMDLDDADIDEVDDNEAYYDNKYYSSSGGSPRVWSKAQNNSQNNKTISQRFGNLFTSMFLYFATAGTFTKDLFSKYVLRRKDDYSYPSSNVGGWKKDMSYATGSGSGSWIPWFGSKDKPYYSSSYYSGRYYGQPLSWYQRLYNYMYDSYSNFSNLIWGGAAGYAGSRYYQTSRRRKWWWLLIPLLLLGGSFLGYIDFFSDPKAILNTMYSWLLFIPSFIHYTFMVFIPRLIFEIIPYFITTSIPYFFTVTVPYFFFTTVPYCFWGVVQFFATLSIAGIWNMLSGAFNFATSLVTSTGLFLFNTLYTVAAIGYTFSSKYLMLFYTNFCTVFYTLLAHLFDGVLYSFDIIHHAFDLLTG